MRRSAAPSQTGAPFKRPRFTSPLLGSAQNQEQPNSVNSSITTNSKENVPENHDTPKQLSQEMEENMQGLYMTNLNIHKQNPLDDDLDLSQDVHWTPILKEKVNPASSNQFQSSSASTKVPSHGKLNNNIEEKKIKHIDLQQLDQNNKSSNVSENKEVESEVICKPEKPQFKPFKTPSLQTTRNVTLSEKNGSCRNVDSSNNSGSNTSIEGPSEKYYNVMWCKLSKKKHKKWEGDAILLTKGRTVTLMDMEGKVIGKGAGYKTSELETLTEGQTLTIGGKEIEVMGKLSAEDYHKGVCFQAASKPVSPPKKNIVTSISKPFARPMKGNSSQMKTGSPSTPQAVKPRHDPLAPGALVLPRPNQAHQWEHNRNKLPVVDVVVDPYLSQHLRPHQRDGVVFLYECILGLRNYNGHGAILADEMGLGKTLQCISLIWTLLRQGPYGGKPSSRKVIIITPGSLVKNWCREFKKWLGSERLKVFAVSPENKVEEFVSSEVFPVLIISYEMFVRTVDIIRKVNFDLVVCDEGHRLKNSNIKTTTFVTSLPTQRRIVLTGTPVQNDLQELFAIMDFCNPGILGSSTGFRRVYEDPIVASRQPGATPAERELGEGRAAELNRLTGMFILRRTSDINNKYLPPKVEMVLFCRLSPLQSSLYHHLVNSRAVHSCLSRSSDPAQHLMCISALRKLCNHPCLIYDKVFQSEQHKDNIDGDMEVQLYKNMFTLFPSEFNSCELNLEHSGKLGVLAVLLKAMHEAVPLQRVVLVSNYTATLNVLEMLCKVEGYSFLRLDGQTPTAKRQPLVERFNSPYSQDFVFLLSSKAGGVGLNLIGASRLVLYDVDWNPANDLQAMARVWRDGQKQRVFIYRLLSTGTLEEKMYQRQVSKQGLSGVVVDAKTETKLHFTPEELKDLFFLQENTLCGTHDLLSCECHTSSQNIDSAGRDEKSQTVHRSCQLLATDWTAKKTQKNKCMSELMEWNHEHGPAPPLSNVDSILNDEELQEVTFAFWNKCNS